MRGGRRVGSGRKAKDLDTLKLSGSFRPSRHSHLLQAVPKPAAPSREQVRAAGDLPSWIMTGLSAPGLAFAAALEGL